MEDGVIYVSDGWGSVYAIDVSSGKRGTFRRKFDPGIDKAWAGDVACCGVNNRGVALWKDKVISISLDGRLFALIKASGEKVWERKIADPALGETLTMAPLIVRDFALLGPAGGEFGIRGFVDATDLNTGSRLGGLTRLRASASPAARPGRTARTLATAGNLAFLGHIDGTFAAYDARTLKELWNFDAGTGINASPVAYAVNGKEYVAVLVGSRQPNNIMTWPPNSRTRRRLPCCFGL